MAGIECGRELLKRRLLASTLRAFEQDDRAAAVRDLRQLQLGQMLAKRGNRLADRAASRESR